MIHHFQNIDLTTLAPYINWTYFFRAWQLTGKYEGIEHALDCPACRPDNYREWLIRQDNPDKATEALQLLADARTLLNQYSANKILTARAEFGLFEARAEGEDIVLRDQAGNPHRLPMLRQQEVKTDGTPYLSLADFISPSSDHVGLFAVSVSGANEAECSFNEAGDPYNALLVKSLADRLAEATAEWLHQQVRRRLWGYAKDEQLSIENMLRSRYTGIRPAVGYPSLPDQSLIFRIDKLMPLDPVGISLTENGAMHPNASVCGMMLAHPQSSYFMIGKIGNDQLADYARRSGRTEEDMKRWLAQNLN